MSTDRKVLKVMRKRLCAQVGCMMADAVLAAAQNEQKEAEDLRSRAQLVGDELAKIDAMLGIKIEQQQMKASKPQVSKANAMLTLTAHIPRLGGDSERALCESILDAFKQPICDYKMLAGWVSKHPWPATPPELREHASVVAAWLRDHP